LNNDLININSSLADLRRKEDYKAVFGVGDIDNKIIFIGEAPGKNETILGQPFCGASGKILDTLFESIQKTRSDIYITNIVKDRPPKNRDPKKDEIAIYKKILMEEISIIKPKVIITLGRIPMSFILENYTDYNLYKKKTINDLRATIINCNDFDLVPLLHPANALYNRKKLPSMIDDFQVVKKYFML